VRVPNKASMANQTAEVRPLSQRGGLGFRCQYTDRIMLYSDRGPCARSRTNCSC
jgi:hypothetical protein